MEEQLKRTLIAAITMSPCIMAETPFRNRPPSDSMLPPTHTNNIFISNPAKARRVFLAL